MGVIILSIGLVLTLSWGILATILYIGSAKRRRDLEVESDIKDRFSNRKIRESEEEIKKLKELLEETLSENKRLQAQTDSSPEPPIIKIETPEIVTLTQTYTLTKEQELYAGGEEKLEYMVKKKMIEKFAEDLWKYAVFVDDKDIIRLRRTIKADIKVVKGWKEW